MAPKDYIGRGQVNPPPSRPKGSFPWLRLLITVSLMAGFGGFLWFIQDAKQDQVQQSRANVSKPVPPLPAKPQEEWEFMKILPDPNTTVEIDMPAERVSDKTYVMQCGSFRKPAQAEAMRAQIAFQGLEAAIQTSADDGGTWYRVVLGPYTKKRHAERHRHKMQSTKITGCRIW